MSLLTRKVIHTEREFISKITKLWENIENMLQHISKNYISLTSFDKHSIYSDPWRQK